MAETRMDESNQSHERKASWMLVDTNAGGRFDPFGDPKHIVLDGRGTNTPSTTGSLSSLSHEVDHTPASTTKPKKMYPHVRTN
eukprot:CAMPEP_0119025506 /NCGR_PEP_ID=MMETSP1176-20130426/33864_1 /TAXON_ID=265551 /ORGANISM="Synedropsis recta cf, Strain CCMP1620" /LENGTH=82 /DNA_ID=CAMNT_0006981051 /DNA_START=173 /DNA_END=418 /DNA_ORIENTATION=-